ncbi:polymorphic toxin-type HINT domain-containing protein [Brevibacillus sp. AG]|uniref:polymorphic toxin-type HINT domain-containing protein n=1 Tax=Brevibacillus sp. AG TaxID=3020891 RepID=UPI00232D8685|nr:polymorphic toxin-type HINT domain-containing protein [Brevibacillus sp. AG]MDC0764914.1 polymorphic toxin-type HINT domain-containing protein [Brevibacillus sp. AG]
MKKYLRIFLVTVLLLTLLIPTGSLQNTVQRVSASDLQKLNLPSINEEVSDESRTISLFASHEKVELLIGEWKKVRIYNDSGSNRDDVTQDVSWNQKKKEIVSIENGKFTATAIGTTIVTAQYGGQEIQIPVQVKSSLEIKASENDGNAILSWENVDAASYTVKRGVNNRKYEEVADDLRDNSFSDDTVEPGKAYYYMVEAHLSNGNTVASKPVKIKMKKGHNDFTLETDSTSLDLQVGESKSVEIIAKFTEGTFLDVSSKVKWNVEDESIISISNDEIRALHAGKTKITGFYNQKEIQMEVFVSTNESIHLIAQQEDEEIKLSWSKWSENVKYIVQRRVGNEDFEQITDEILETNYKDSSLQEGTTYEYRIMGVNAQGSQTVSNVTSVQIHQDKSILVPSLDNVALHVGGEKHVTVELQNPDGTMKDVTNEALWKVKDETIISVSNGKITAHAEGTTLISAYYEDKMTEIGISVADSQKRIHLDVTPTANGNALSWNTDDKIKSYSVKIRSSNSKSYEEIISKITETSYVDHASDQITNESRYYVVTGMTETGEMILSNEVEITSQKNALNSVLPEEIKPLRTPGPVEDTIGASGNNWYSITLQENHTLSIFTPDLQGSGTSKDIYSDPTQLSLAYTTKNTLTYTPKTSGTYYIKIKGNSGQKITISTGDGSSFEQPYAIVFDKDDKKDIGKISGPGNDSIYFTAELTKGYNYHIWGDPLAKGWVLYDSTQREVLSGTTARTDIKVDTSGTYYIKLLTGENAGEHQYYILKSIPISISTPQSYTIGPEKKIWYQVKAKANHTLRVYTPGLSGFGTGKYLYDDPNKAALKTVSLDTLTFMPTETGTYFVVVSGSSGKTFSITAGDGSDLNQAYSVSLDGIKGTIATFSTPSNDSIFFRTELKAGFNYHLWGKGTSPIEGWVLYDSAKKEILSDTTSRMDVRIATSGTYYIKMLTGGSGGENKYEWLVSTPVSFPSPQTDTFGSSKDIWYIVKAQANQTIKIVQKGLSWTGSITLLDDPNGSKIISSSSDTLTYTPLSSGIYFIRITDQNKASGDVVTINIEGVEPWQPSSTSPSPNPDPENIEILKENESIDVTANSGKSLYYKFTPSASGNYRFFTSPNKNEGPENDTYLQLYSDATFTTLLAENDNVPDGPYGKLFSKLENHLSAGTTYYLKLSAPNGSLNTRITVEAVDADSKREGAIPAEWDEIYTDQLSSRYDVDYFVLTAKEMAYMNLYVTNNMLILEDSHGNMLQTFHADEQNTLFVTETSGTYYAKVVWNKDQKILTKSDISTLSTEIGGSYQAGFHEPKRISSNFALDTTPGFEKSLTVQWRFSDPHQSVKIQVLRQNTVVYEETRTNLEATSQTFTWNGRYTKVNPGQWAPTDVYFIKIVASDAPKYPITLPISVVNTNPTEEYDVQYLISHYNSSISSETIRKSQEKLKAMMFYDGPITGRYDEEFLMSVIAFEAVLNRSTHVSLNVNVGGGEILKEQGELTNQLVHYINSGRATGKDKYGLYAQFLFSGDIVIYETGAALVPAFRLTKIGGKLVKKAAKTMDELFECNCFTAGTKVLTEDGEKNIEDIVVGDKVLSKNDKTGEIAYKKVTHLHRNKKEYIYELTVGNQIIETTDNHPFWVEGRQWVLAVDLQVGNQLKQSNGNTLKIEKINVVKHDERVKVYNFTVEDFNTYFVTDLGIWVHNIGNCDWDDIEKYFAPNTRRHILEGEINEKGKAVGWHHEPSSRTNRIVGTPSSPDSHGVYEGVVDIFSGTSYVRKTENSTFFPKHWSADDVMTAIFEVYVDAIPSLKKNGTEFVQKWEGKHSSGIKIELWLDKDGRITTAYPIYEP